MGCCQAKTDRANIQVNENLINIKDEGREYLKSEFEHKEHSEYEHSELGIIENHIPSPDYALPTLSMPKD